jgi:hypothetical protein|tara:strand:- start:303 stop:587 length:285 start_codon:yes stop_codon:yes gene_type:complete
MVYVINNDFKNILQPLTSHGWQFIKEKDDEIQMNKKYSELEDISIKKSSTTNVIHITVPIQNSVYSYYKRHTDLELSKTFLYNYVSELNSIDCR